MILIKHIGHHRVLLALMCLGISVNSTSALADTQSVQEPLRGRESRDVVVAVAETGEAAEAPATATSAPATVATAAPGGQIVATVNGNPIFFREFDMRYAAVMRDRFYHGKPPEGQEEAVRKEVIDLMIEDELLVEEAERRGFKPDEAKIEEAAAIMEARYGAMPEWKRDRDQALSFMRRQVGRPSLIEQAREALQDVPQPTPDEARAYYEQKPELFTEPEKLRMSVILLKVDPGAPKADWDKAREEAQGLYLRIKDGADFAELARRHSGDKSAASGGDLGYVHGGMLPENLQDRVSKFQVGVVAEPVTVLEGVALYRLDERVAPVLREFADVEQRAQDLLKRDRKDQAWKEAINRLRGDAKIDILVPTAGDSGKQSDSPAGAQLIVTKSGNLLSNKPDAELTPPVRSGEQSDSDKQKDGGKKKVSKKKVSKKKISGKMP